MNENAAGPAVGWNDLDSLEVMNNTTSGLSNEERQSVTTLWAMANAPMYLGGDLTTLDNFGKQILSNDEVLAVNQSGHPATEALAGDTPVWISDLGDGSYYVALFNLNAFPSRVVVPWNSLGFANAARVRDLWNHIELGRYDRGFSTTLLGHGVRLLKVEGEGDIRTTESQSYEAESATLNGSAVIAACPACSGGEKVGGLALGLNNNVTFNNVVVRRDGVYQMQIDSMTQGPRSLIYSVNGGPLRTLNVGGGSFFLPSSTTVSPSWATGSIRMSFITGIVFSRISFAGYRGCCAVQPISMTYGSSSVSIFSGAALYAS